MVKIHSTAYVNNVAPIALCGKNIGWELKFNGFFTLPFQINPTEGNHDYRTCEGCQKKLQILKDRLSGIYSGNDRKPAFPLCCDAHERLQKLKEFDKAVFDNVPEWTAEKIIFTNQHVVNRIHSDDWLDDITDYIEFVIFSFGDMPEGYGSPLFLDLYFYYIRYDLENMQEVPKDRQLKLLAYLDNYGKVKKEPSTDLNVLIDCYTKWLNIFPFELNEYFGNLKEHFGKQLPILNGKPVVNRYSGKATSKLHSKDSLIGALVNLTNDLITKLNAATLFDKGLITDANKLKLDLVLSSRKMKLKQGYRNNSATEEQRYRKILKEWFRDEKEFLDELIPLLIGIPPKKVDQGQGQLSVKQIALIHAYEGVQITRENAKTIAANYGYKSTSSGEGLYQDYTFFCSPTNRKSRPDPYSKKKLINRIELINSVLPHLSKGLKRAEDEMGILESYIDN